MKHFSAEKSKLLSAAILLAFSIATSPVLVAANPTDNIAGQNKTTAESLHGHGKKPLNCDMSILTITHAGKSTEHRVDTLIVNDAEGLIHPEARRMFAFKVLPMTRLLEQYPDSDKVTFVTCDEDEVSTFTTSEITADPYNYILSVNNARRLRLATYNQTKKRARYRTKVKNITEIRIE